MKTLTTLYALFILLLPLAGSGSELITVGGLDGIDPHAPTNTAHVALALSGGGARGLASVGVLKAFEEKQITIDAIAGTSMGGVIGGLYACGYSSSELVDIINEIDFSKILANEPERLSMLLTQRQEREQHLFSIRFDGLRPQIPQGLTRAQNLISLLTRLTNRANYRAGRDFSRLTIPFATVGTDLVSGETVLLDHGSLASAIRATLAFPLAFTAIEIDGHLLMDGGMLLPLPVDIARSMTGAGTPVVAVNVTSPLLSADEIITPIDIANQVTTIMTAEKVASQLAKADFAIHPVPDSYSAVDFDEFDSLLTLGYQAGLAIADSILAVQSSQEDTQQYQPCTLTVSSPDERLAARVRAAMPNLPFTRRQLIADLKALVRTERIFSLSASIDVCESERRPDALPQVKVHLVVEPQMLLADIRLQLSGVTLYDELSLVPDTLSSEGYLTPGRAEELADGLLDRYRQDGYDLANIQSLSVDYATRVVAVAVDEGMVRRIDVVNNTRSKDWLVRSYVPCRTGHPYSSAQADDGLSALFGTDLFDRVSLELVPVDGGALVQIGVEEKAPTQVRVGWHWDDEYHSEEFLELLDDNIFGAGMRYLIHGQFGLDREDYHTELRITRIFFTYLTASIEAHYRLLDRNLFLSDGSSQGVRHEDRWGVSFKLGQLISRLGAVSGRLQVEELAIRDERIEVESRFGLRSLIFQSLVENLDRTPFPHRGGRSLIELQLAGKLIGGDTEFTRFNSLIETYHPVGTSFTYHARFSLGLSRRGLPASEKFYIGGMNSLSGFRTNEVSGDKMILLNQELRANLPLSLYLSARWDIGNVYTSADNIKLKDLRQGLGLSLAVDLPIGPLEFGHGTGNSPKDRFYFYAGFRF